MDQLSKQQLQTVDGRFGDGVMSCFDYGSNVEHRTVKGVTGRKGVEKQIELIVKMLE
ncbi:hypothetical protein GJ744_007339 [Endocarpon pusillum]|uniref:Uncharacterized protein n=1 Tax=Endocarpon pusillum TaxID=364733 RepID=A0A8H7AIR6_9EURO|nr:hypothetical protein GJ744_007339 [Endocarpon pusillum]